MAEERTRRVLLTKKQLLNLLANANFDLFSDRKYKHNAEEIKRWLKDYLIRAKFIKPKEEGYKKHKIK